MRESERFSESTQISQIHSPGDSAMDDLCGFLSARADRWVTPGDWPAESLAACGRAGVYRWFMPESAGGMGWDEPDQTRGYLRLAAADLTATFIITQFMGACRRIAGSERTGIADRWLPMLLDGRGFATVGISHLTTSRRHLAKPVLEVTADAGRGGFRMRGSAPWVTGAAHADVFVLAGTLADGRELMAAVPADSPGLRCGPGADLVALSASCTDQVILDDVWVASENVIAGPIEQVMRSGVGAGTGGLQTSTLAIGLSRAAADYLVDEATRRPDLERIAHSIVAQVDAMQDRLLNAAAGDHCDPASLRGDANRLVMRTTQTAMTAAKGAGFVQGHPVGRWCREALFFLVWSCPQPVAAAQMCELAGITN